MHVPSDSENAPTRRMDAIKLAKASKWDDLKRLVDAEPLTAQQVDSYGMLPLHWACTEPHSISDNVLMSLLKAFPHGARATNTAEMLPLQIAIKAQAKIEWLQALLASYPDAVLKQAPSGEHAVQLARKSHLDTRSIKLLDEMFHHVCDKNSVSPDQFGYETTSSRDVSAPGSDSDRQTAQQFAPHSSSSSTRRATVGPNQLHSNSHTNYKTRAMSDNDFQLLNAEALRSTGSGNGNGHNDSFRSTAVTSSTTSSQRATMQQQQQQQPRMSSRAVVTLPPRWTIAPSCYICSQKFGPFHKKRHHCRNCGQSICSDHSARERMRLPHYGLNDRHRVCTACHDVLRQALRTTNASASQRFASAAPSLSARRSDEAAQRLPENLLHAPQQLERHVSAPARATMKNNAAAAAAAAPYNGIHDQVASLQKQVSLLMEEKELAESQLRMQAELLGDALEHSERLTSLSRRESRSRLNSFQQQQQQLKLASSIGSTGSNGSLSASGGPPSAGASTSEVPTLLTGGYGHMYGSFENSSSSRGIARTHSSSSFTRSRDVASHSASSTDVLLPAVGQTRAMAAAAAAISSGQRGDDDDEFAHVAVAVESTYDAESDASGERPTDGFGDLHDDDPDDDDDGDSDPPDASDAFHGAAGSGHHDVDIDDDDDDDDYGTLPEIDVMVNLGLSMMERGLASAAVQAFVRAVDMCPNDATLHSYLGRAYYADDNLDAAVDAISRSLELEPSATNSTLLGKILFEKGDHEQAIAAYQKSLDIQQSSST